MAITRMKNSGIKTGQLKYDSALGGLPPVMAAPTATAGTASASIAFTAVDGATSYTVLSTPDSVTATGTSSPISITGLTGGTSYTFQIRATNSVGTGAYSAASNSVTPATPSYSLVLTANTTQNWTVPSGTTKIAAYVIAGGGGAGGGGGVAGGLPGGGGGAGGGCGIVGFKDFSIVTGKL